MSKEIRDTKVLVFSDFGWPGLPDHPRSISPETHPAPIVNQEVPCEAHEHGPGPKPSTTGRGGISSPLGSPCGRGCPRTDPVRDLERYGAGHPGDSDRDRCAQIG